MKKAKSSLNNFDVTKIVNSYRIEDYMKAHEQGNTAAVVESDNGVTEWEKHFTTVNIPWATLAIDSITQGKVYNIIWKVIDKAQPRPEPFHFRPLSK